MLEQVLCVDLDDPFLMFFRPSIPGEHENYFDELAELLRRSAGQPAQRAAGHLRYDVEPLTAMHDGARG